MSVSEELRRAVDTCLGPRPVRNPSTEARRLLTLYRRHAADEGHRRRMDEAVADSELGMAAYCLGVHYQVQSRPDRAEHWLRIAAARDIADAAVRLAMLYEYRSVLAANTTISTTTPTDDDDLTAARYWYRVGAAAGYATADDGQHVDPPPMALDCCPQVETAAGSEAAEEIIAAAHRQADQLRRQARADVRVIIDTARAEVDDLARQRAEIEDHMKRLRRLVNGIAAAGTVTPIRGRRRGRLTGQVEPDNEADAWARMLEHFQQQSAPHSRHLMRPLLTRIMALLDRIRGAEPEELDLDVETKDAVAAEFPPPPWASTNTPFRVRAG
ncbi:hypothetical protein I0C86_38390 [Plantactinospora sp. S1510]|uniref:Sel1 repeat family protein n=1 Tax=Plantactinospora alkalitolerans TaxID=2789879 RepID=A0ABS0H9J7_9ACTN|nr:hypothetical protein [Plantactinospora alkalitolerans]MBF9134757.1 hypothetical protein [Plantactinospora alkalitolerans]